MKRLVIGILLLTVVIFVRGQDTANNMARLFCYFKDNGEDGLHLAYSKDGLHWTALKHDSSFLAPTVGDEHLIRDPCIIQGPDGIFRLIYTVGWHDTGIGYAWSKDLIHWSEEKYIPMMKQVKGARNCWAPEVFYDHASGEYMIYWATTIPGRFPETDTSGEDKYNHRIYYSLTKDFLAFTPAKLLYDPGFSVIDASIQQSAGRYIMFFKDETLKPVAKKNIRISFSRHLTYGYGAPSAPITGRYWAEGPTALHRNTRWIVYFDQYTNDKMGAVVSSDLKHWTDISDKLTFPKGTRHGTIFQVSKRIFEQIVAR